MCIASNNSKVLGAANVIGVNSIIYGLSTDWCQKTLFVNFIGVAI